MKRAVKVFATMAIALIGCTSYGQFGAKGGLGISRLLIKDNDVNLTQEFGNSGFSFHVGGGYEVFLTDQLAFEPSLLLTQKASSFDFVNLVTFKLLYLELPMNFKIYVADVGGSTRIYGLGGGYAGFLLSAKRDNDKLDIGNNANDDIKSLDFGVNFGAGVQFFESLNIDVSAGIGLANLSSDVGNGLKNKNSVIRLTVTYLFGG